MNYDFILVEEREHLTIITINRPDKMNSLHPPACRELDDAFNKFSEDPDAWLAVITGAGGKAFCAGNDLKWQSERGVKALRDGIDSLKGGFGGITRRFDCFKPIIAAVNGFAVGGGFEIALACDIIIAAEHAAFALPEPKVGAVAAAGGAVRLPRHIPYHQAMGMLLTGRRISAHEAHRLGLVNEVAEGEKLMETALKWADEILECAPLSVRATKEAALMSAKISLEEAVPKVFPGIAAVRRSKDYIEGPAAFAEKRKPQWKGE